MEHSIGLFKEAFLECLDDDYFGNLRLGDGPKSIHEFIAMMTVGNMAMRARGATKVDFPDLTDLNITFNEFLRLNVRIETRVIPLKAFFCEDFCATIASALVREIGSKVMMSPARGAVFAEVGASTSDEWAIEMGKPERVLQIATALADLAAQKLGTRSLLSFFIKAEVAGKFTNWGPHANSGLGRSLPSKVILSDGYSVATTVSRYEEIETSVVAYEWEAKLTLTGADEPAAAACGMIYVFERANGEPVGDLRDLIEVSDSVADTDILQTRAFITQHDDAADIINSSDLCFVWLWERRSGAEKGLGAKCLTGALQDLRRRFKKIRTVLFDVRPGQFALGRVDVEPPMVAIERQTAIEQIVAYIKSMDLSLDMRPIFTSLNNPMRDSLIALHESMGMGGAGDEGDDEGVIDLSAWGDEIAQLFRAAGLDELADSMADEEEVYAEVEAALKHLVFDPYVQYVRVSSTVGFSPSDIGIDPIPHGYAHENIEGIDAFCAHLPAHMQIISIDDVEDCIVCTVGATTPFGNLTEYFTLVPKPRPVNIDSFFRNMI